MVLQVSDGRAHGSPEEFAAMTEGVFLKNALRDGVVIYKAGTGKGRKQVAETGRARP